MKSLLFQQKSASRVRIIRFLVTILALATSIYTSSLCPALAESSPEDTSSGDTSSEQFQIPQPWAEFYYYDEANVLDEAARADILAKNTGLQENYGVQLVVMTCASLPSEDYAQQVAYLRSIMERWQIGGSQGRGFLLAMTVSEGRGGTYLVVAGEGLTDCFPTESLHSLLSTYLEPDFNSGAFSAGVTKFISAAAQQAETYCAAHPELFAASGESDSDGAMVFSEAEAEKKPGLPVLVWVGIGAGTLVFLIALYVLVMSRRSRRRNRRGVHRRSPVISPARSHVTRHESRPTLYIKHSGQGPRWK